MRATTVFFKGDPRGYAHYRVPAIAVSPTGTVVAMAKARKNAGGDWVRGD